MQVLCPGITATEFPDVAETQKGPLVRRLPMLSAEEVVRASLPPAGEHETTAGR